MTAQPVLRCEFGDLPVGTCACPHCRPDVRDVFLDVGLTVVAGWGVELDEPAERPRVVSRWRVQATTRCDRCASRIVVGEVISKTSDLELVCEECAP